MPACFMSLFVMDGPKQRGGMTPLHIAMQFGHEDVYQLLVQVYKGDPNVRDYSGKKPRQYLVSKDTSVSADTYHSKLRQRQEQLHQQLHASQSATTSLLRRYTSFRANLTPSSGRSTLPRERSSRPRSHHQLAYAPMLALVKVSRDKAPHK
ncbi:hypothetical protein B566_EDAN008460 [Ephemera danica]|nr:hypothetical protein B566_EDAN008460 [Ephemera danica]